MIDSCLLGQKKSISVRELQPWRDRAATINAMAIKRIGILFIIYPFKKKLEFRDPKADHMANKRRQSLATDLADVDIRVPTMLNGITNGVPQITFPRCQIYFHR